MEAKSFVLQAILLWNGLPEPLKSCLDVKLFKTRVQNEFKHGELNFPE